MCKYALSDWMLWVDKSHPHHTFSTAKARPNQLDISAHLEHLKLLLQRPYLKFNLIPFALAQHSPGQGRF